MLYKRKEAGDTFYFLGDMVHLESLPTLPVNFEKTNTDLSNGTSIETAQIVGKIALHEAVQKNFLSIVKFLLENGTDVIDLYKEDADQYTPSFYLCAILETFHKKIDTVSEEQLEKLKGLVGESDFFEHVVEAMLMMSV